MSRFASLFFAGALLWFVCASADALQANSPATETVEIDARAAGRPFPHFWEQMFGSGRANLAMRQSYLDDMARVKKVTGFRYVRFHAILHDENGVYSEDQQGNPIYNWSYVDQIYDGLLDCGVRPFVEISFMPRALASRMDYHAFWYKQLVSPPSDYAKWDALMTVFAKHLVERYGIEEIAQWYFEVWNEPNIDFWTGRPAQQTYFELYDHTARALKSVSARIRVGGPSTAQAAWVGDMIAHTTQNHVPLDFVSTHVYGNDVSTDVFHDSRPMPPHQMVCPAVKKVHDEIAHSARPALPLIWSEFNASYGNQQEVTDSIYMGPWLAQTISQCDGMTEMMSYWTFSDVFEEQGVVKTPFYGGFGLLAERGIPKPAFEAFELLHELGEVRLPERSEDVLVTRKKDGTLVIAAWNLFEPGVAGAPRTIHLSLNGVPATAHVIVKRVDADHGDTLATWKRMGSPSYPSKAQIDALRRAAETGTGDRQTIDHGNLTIEVPPMGLAVLEVH